MINWSGYNWIPRERWGLIHPDKSYCWYDETAIELSDDRIHLLTHYNPRYFSHLDLTSKVGVGLISCTEEFSHGTFEIECKLPVGNHLWPAFWMWSWSSWPPEIDVFEGYTGFNSSYFKFRPLNPFGFWNVQTNIHYNESNGDKNSIKGKTHWFGFKNPSKNFIKYKVDWFPDIINIYFDGKKVRVLKDKKILDQFNLSKMNVIINNHITARYDLKNVKKSVFTINYFKYDKY